MVDASLDISISVRKQGRGQGLDDTFLAGQSNTRNIEEFADIVIDDQVLWRSRFLLRTFTSCIAIL